MAACILQVEEEWRAQRTLVGGYIVFILHIAGEESGGLIGYYFLEVWRLHVTHWQETGEEHLIIAAHVGVGGIQREVR